MESEFVMTGLVPVIHVLFVARKTWMRGTEPAHDGYKRAGAALVRPHVSADMRRTLVKALSLQPTDVHSHLTLRIGFTANFLDASDEPSNSIRDRAIVAPGLIEEP